MVTTKPKVSHPSIIIPRDFSQVLAKEYGSGTKLSEEWQDRRCFDLPELHPEQMNFINVGMLQVPVGVSLKEKLDHLRKHQKSSGDLLCGASVLGGMLANYDGWRERSVLEKLRLGPEKIDYLEFPGDLLILPSGEPRLLCLAWREGGGAWRLLSRCLDDLCGTGWALVYFTN